MPEADFPERPAAPRRRRWLRVLGWVAGILVLLVALLLVFANPIVFFLARRYAPGYAQQAGYTLEFNPSGSIWSGLKIDKVSVAPAPGAAASPLEKAQVGSVAVDYSWWDLVRGRIDTGIRSVRVADATIVLDPAKSGPPSPFDPKAAFLSSPPIPSAALELRNVNLLLRGGITLEGLDLSVQNGRDDGVLRARRLLVPGLQPFENVEGVVALHDRVLDITALKLGGVGSLERVRADLSQSGDGRWLANGTGRLLGGALSFKAALDRANTPKPRLRADVEVNGLPVAWPRALLAGEVPAGLDQLGGALDRLVLTLAAHEGSDTLSDFDLSATLSQVRAPGGTALPRVVARAKGTAPFALNQPPNAPPRPWHEGLAIEASATLDQPAAAGVGLDAFDVALRLRGRDLEIERLNVRRARNSVALSGTARLPEQFPAETPALLAAISGAADVLIDAPDLGQLSLAGQTPPVLGAAKVAIKGKWDGQKADGTLALEGSNLSAPGIAATVEGVNIRAAANGDLAWIESGEVRLDAQNRLGLGGYARLTGARDYRLDVAAELARLAAFQPLLAAAGVKDPLDGAVRIAWKIEGRADSTTLADILRALIGGGSVSVRGLKFGTEGPIEADIEATHAAGIVQVPVLALRARGFELKAAVLAEEPASTITVDPLSLARGSDTLLTGRARVPFDFTALRLPTDKPLDVRIGTLQPLPLAALWAAAGQKGAPPLSGNLGLTLTAAGTLADPQLDLSAQLRGAKAGAAPPKLSPADADIAVTARGSKVAVTGVVKQPPLQSLTIQAETPINLGKVLAGAPLDLNAPLRASIKLPASSLGSVTGLLPGVRYLQGTAAADITVGGTLAKPEPRGTATADIAAARLENEAAPALRNVRLRAAFSEREARIETLSGEAAGGQFSLSGRADLSNSKAIGLDFALRAKDFLLARDDSLLVRANADVRVSGPLTAASVSGTVGLTKSRFLKDVEILPLTLPGQPKPPPSAPPVPKPRSTGSGLGISTPPLRDWKLALTIKTEDPFRVRGNLANGAAVVDLRVGGTGGNPQLEGNVVVSNLTARLPFSRLEFAEGQITFTPDQPLNPVLNLNGVSEIRGRTVNVAVYGRAEDPKTIFTSEPPLAQEQILTLLATGVTLDELRGNSELLAGRAASLAIQELYRKVFKPKTKETDDGVFDRFDFDLTGADPKTGKQGVEARYRVNERVVVTSDFSQDGNFRGKVKYLLRFR